MAVACCLREVALLSPVDKKIESTPWSVILITQLLGVVGLGALLIRLQAEWYDFLLVGLFIAYEVLVIRALVRRASASASPTNDRM
jgi:hypothetical protein